MPLLYNTVLRKDPRKQDDPGKWHPVLRSIVPVNEKEVAKQIADETTLNPKEAEMAIYQLLKVLKTQLLKGNTVQLGDWGSFFLTINSEGVENEKDVTANQVKQVNVHFRAGKDLRQAINEATFKPVSTMTNK